MEVINAGVGGYASTQEFLYLASELISYEPDIVIIYDGWNDQVVNNYVLAKRGQLEPFSTFKTPTHWMLDARTNAGFTLAGAGRIFLASLAGEANLFISDLVIVKRLRSFAGWLKGKTAAPTASKLETERVFDPASITLYRENLERMILLSKQRGFKMGIFLQPIMSADDKPLSNAEKKIFDNIQDLPASRSFYRDARSVFERLKRENSDKRSLCIEDLSHVFAGEISTVYNDPGHLEPAGNRIVADALVRKLKGCGFLHR